MMLRLALLEVGMRAASRAVSYLCRFGRLAAADGGEEPVPASAEPLVGRGSAKGNAQRFTAKKSDRIGAGVGLTGLLTVASRG